MSDHWFLPEGIPEWQQPFWDSLKQRSIKVQRCASCKTFRHIPKELCAHCHSASFTWEPVSGRGVIYTYTIVHRAPTPAYQEEAPYAIVHGAMEEGFRMVATMTGTELDSVEIGMPVRVVYTDLSPQWTIVEFESVTPSVASAESAQAVR